MDNDDKKQESRMLGPVGLDGLLREKFTFWHTPDGEPFVDFHLDGVRHSVSINGGGFPHAVYALVNKYAPTKMPSVRGIEEFQALVAAHAMMSKMVRESYVRIADADGTLFYDLSNPLHEVVEVAGGKWAVKPPSGNTPRFVKASNQRAQINPRKTDKTLVDLLRPFVTVKSEGDLSMIAAWLVGCFKPGGPYPVLIINGEQGSAKSTTTRLLRRLVDPHGLDMREPPNTARDLVAMARNSFVLAFDNISHIPSWFSDRLCMVATGTGALGGRALYTNTDEAAYRVVRPIILNGIPAFVEREDLADRAINIELPAITPDKRMDDDTFWGAFDAAYEEILGALFNAVAVAHRDFGTTKLENSPRMANFARWAVAGLGPVGGKAFFDAYALNRREAAEHFIEHSDVTQALLAFLKPRDRWVGTWVELLGELNIYAPVNGSKFWPENSLQLRNRLVRSAKEMRAMGVEWKNQGRESGTGRSRVEIYKAADFADRGYSVSATAKVI